MSKHTPKEILRWCAEYIERDRRERFAVGDSRAGAAAHLLTMIAVARDTLSETESFTATDLDGTPIEDPPKGRRLTREEMGKLADAMGLEHDNGVLPVDPIFAQLPFVKVSSPKYHYDRLLTPPPPGPSSRSVIEGAVDPVAQNQAYLAREREPATMGSRVVKGIDLERRTGIERRQPAICMEFMGHQPERREVNRRARVPAPVKAAMNPTYEETWEQRRQRLMTPRDRAVELLEKALALSKQLGDLIAERDHLLKGTT